MIKKIAKLATGLLLGALLTVGVKETAHAEITYTTQFGVIYGVDTNTGFFTQLPAGTVIPAGAFGNWTNMMLSYDSDGHYVLTPTIMPAINAETYVLGEYTSHVLRFQGLMADPAFQLQLQQQALLAQMAQIPQWPYTAYNPCTPCVPAFNMPTIPTNISMPELPNIDWASFYPYGFDFTNYPWLAYQYMCQ